MSLALAIALSLAATPMVAATSLSAFQWENRILVLLGEPGSPDYVEQHRLLEAAQSGLADRDMLVLAVSGDSVDPLFGTPGPLDADAIRQAIEPSGAPFEAVLIGKDGGIKHRQSEPIDPQTLFGIIDAMPMRASEMANDR